MSAPDERSHDAAPRASVLICTYRRDEVLVQTVAQLLPLCEASAAELIVVDQLADHTPAVREQLAAWAGAGRIRYVNLDRSGLTHARNVGAGLAAGPILIYFDDDVLPGARAVEGHVACYAGAGVAAVAGQVLNVGGVPAHAPGSFHHDARIESFGQLYGANFSVRRDVYHAVGGSDERLGVHAYTEDQILAHKLTRAGHRICYEPAASVVHLMHPSGGCRIGDESQPTAESDKSFSKLYFMFVAEDLSWAQRRSTLWGALRHGPLRRHNLVRPWRQPAAWLGFGIAVARAYRSARPRAQ